MAWVEQDDKHRQLFESIKDEKQLSKAIRQFETFDEEAAWNRYIEAISKRTRKRRYLRWSVAASIAAVVILSTLTLLKPLPQREPVTREIAQQILPGQPKAYIELSNGEVYDLQNLEKREEDQLANHAGITVKENTVVNAKATASAEPEVVTLVTPRGGEYKLLLNDGTQVWLNADTRLEFPDRFLSGERTVKLSGEAYFSVAKDTERPFIVRLGNIDIEALGTEFNISAYSNDAYIKTTLVEGKVSVTNPIQREDRNILSPGEQASLDKNDHTIEVRKVDVYQFIAWKEGRFVFEYQTLGDITRILERWYDVQFVFLDNELKETPFSGEFLRYDEISKVYDIIIKTGTPIKFTEEGRTIQISN